MGKYEDRTDPWAVKVRRQRVEVHDHRDGICNLKAGEVLGYTKDSCYLDLNWHDKENWCSCSWCSMGAPEENRRRRYEGKAQARNWQSEY